jgi:hypothetical protein
MGGAQMTQRIGCLHAHHSAISAIDQGLAGLDLALVHFVEPGLIGRLTGPESLPADLARQRLIAQLEWMAQCHVDSILVSCTNYVALLGDTDHVLSVPLIKIDEPFFADIYAEETPLLLVFTNPATVTGTMERLYQFATQRGKGIQVEVRVIMGTFDLVMQGKHEEYYHTVATYLQDLVVAEPGKRIAVAQLSMVAAAREVALDCNIDIGNTVTALSRFMQSHGQPGR